MGKCGLRIYTSTRIGETCSYIASNLGRPTQTAARCVGVKLESPEWGSVSTPQAPTGRIRASMILSIRLLIRRPAELKPKPFLGSLNFPLYLLYVLLLPCPHMACPAAPSRRMVLRPHILQRSLSPTKRQDQAVVSVVCDCPSIV